jgi:hypothetical protein
LIPTTQISEHPSHSSTLLSMSGKRQQSRRLTEGRQRNQARRSKRRRTAAKERDDAI